MRKAPTPAPEPETAEPVRQEASLRQVIESISSELELRPLLTIIIREACQLLGADRGSIGLINEARGTVRTEAVYRMPEDELGTEMPPGVGLAGQVLSRGEPVIVQRYGDLAGPTRASMLEDAMLGMPIVWRDRIIGFFGIGAMPPRRFAERDVELLGLLARHAAIAIHNARIYESERRRVARITTVSRIGQLITGRLSLDEILHTAVDAIAGHLDYSSIALFVVSPEDDQTLLLSTRSGASAVIIAGHGQTLQQGIIGIAARERRSLLVEDVQSHPQYIPIPGCAHMISEIAAPIIIGEKLLGVLNIESDRRLDQDDLVGIEIIAGQLGVAIENARLFTETELALDEMQLLFETSRRISMAVDIPGVVDAYLSHVAVRGRYVCSVGLYRFDEQGRMSAEVLGRWSPEEGLTHPAESYAHLTYHRDLLLSADRTVTIADVHSDPRVSEEFRRIQREHGRPAVAMIPLLARGQRIGVVALSYPKVHAWSEADLRPFEITAALLAATLRNRQQQQQLLEHDQQLAVLAERQRVARELHDSVSQQIFAMMLLAQSIGPAFARDPAEGERHVVRLVELGQTARAEMRALLVELRSSGEYGRSDQQVAASDDLRRNGLAAALRRYVERMIGDNLALEVELGDYKRQPAGNEQALYRIAQEALTNIIKHARAARGIVQLAMEPGHVRLVVRDDGCGFVHEPHRRREGRFGLHTMRERAEALGGSFELVSAPQRGTRITVRLPRRDQCVQQLETGETP